MYLRRGISAGQVGPEAFRTLEGQAGSHIPSSLFAGQELCMLQLWAPELSQIQVLDNVLFCDQHIRKTSNYSPKYRDCSLIPHHINSAPPPFLLWVSCEDWVWTWCESSRAMSRAGHKAFCQPPCMELSLKLLPAVME